MMNTPDEVFVILWYVMGNGISLWGEKIHLIRLRAEIIG